MARRKKKIKKLSEEETDELINNWIEVIDEMRDFFFQYSSEEEGDMFYDRFLRKFQNVEDVFRTMVENDMFVHESECEHRETEDVIDSIKPKLQSKGQRNDN